MSRRIGDRLAAEQNERARWARMSRAEKDAEIARSDAEADRKALEIMKASLADLEELDNPALDALIAELRADIAKGTEGLTAARREASRAEASE